jgi:hypothetical protein
MENVHRNLESFDAIYEILRKNGNFIMFSEGICIQEKRLHPLRKGTARLAFGAEEKFGLDVHIVPVGINYTYPSRFRKEVMINFHEAFSIKELRGIYDEHPARALNVFNQKCKDSLLKEVIIIEDPENDWLAEQLLRMERNNIVHPFFKWRFDTDDRRLAEKRVGEKVNQLSKTSKPDLQLLSKKVENYVNLLANNRLRDENVARKLNWGFFRYAAIIAGLPVFIAGFIANLIPFIIPKIVCDKLIKDLRFYSSVFIGGFTLLYLIYFLVLLILGGVLAGWKGILLVLLVPLSGYFVLYYQEIFRERLRTLRFSLKKIFDPALVKELFSQRKSIIDVLDKVRV